MTPEQEKQLAWYRSQHLDTLTDEQKDEYIDLLITAIAEAAINEERGTK